MIIFLFSHIFDYCTNNKHFNGADLYEKFRNYLRNYVENLCHVNYDFIYFDFDNKNIFQSISNLQDQNILEFYINQWKKYRISSKILHGIRSYFHRNYVKREYDSGNPDICEIYSVRNICIVDLVIFSDYHLDGHTNLATSCFSIVL